MPEVIYVRRRVAAAVIVLLLVALFIGLAVHFAGKKDDSTAEAAVTATPVSTPAPESTPEHTTSPDTTTPATTSATSTETSKKTTCGVEDLLVEARVSQATVPAGKQPTFYMTITNPTKADCQIDTTHSPMRFEVYSLSTNQRVWSDIDCNPPISTGTETFKPGEPRHFEAVWSRTTSAPGKCSARQEVQPGSYFLHTVVGDNPSVPVTFNLAG